nr:Alpha-D-phosphohexomutase domain containing protein [Haemonchus contortus]
MVIRNVTKYDWVIKVKSDVPQAIRFETDKAVVDSRKYVVLKTALSLKDLPQQQTAPKIYVFARPLFNYNENCVRVWIQRERNELACQLAYVVHLLVNDKVFSAEKLVLDLPGQASAIDAVPFAIEEDLDSRCETALNIDEDTNTANQVEEKLLEHARAVAKPEPISQTSTVSGSGRMAPEQYKDLMNKVNAWLAADKCKRTNDEIAALAKAQDFDALAARMYGRLKFGTAGIRARMEGGFARLNEMTILIITHGFAKYLLNVFQGQQLTGVAIGYDARHNSRRFAVLAANVFLRNGIPVHFFSEECPTPVVSWATVKLGCNAGLIITASHNPKEDNGYKAYWNNGAQIIDPHDTEIMKLAEAAPFPLPNEYWDTADMMKNPLFRSADTVIDPYFEIEKKSLNFYRQINASTPLKFTYSAFHGVGHRYAKRMFSEFGFKDDHFISVPEQQEPNPDFPTVPFPNPEEGASVLALSFKTADANGSTVVIANDPDADRVQLAEKNASGGWRVFTGNEMGALLSWWIWVNWSQIHSNVPKSDIYVLNSAVSSQMIRTIAEKEGFKSDVTLTGFKWMGNKADELRKKGKHVILAWEESIGFMPGHTMDKDGLSSAAMFAEMAAWLHTQKQTLQDRLFFLYFKYGYHLVRSTYWFTPSPDVTASLFNSLRSDLKYPETIGPHKVKSVRDLTTGYDNSQPDNKAVLPISTTSEMITFTLENGSVVTLRASGTEPKIKYYIELKTAPGKKESDLVEVNADLMKLENAVVETLLRPQQFGLVPRK